MTYRAFPDKPMLSLIYISFVTSVHFEQGIWRSF